MPAHDHGCSHDHGHGHDHALVDFGRAFAIGITLNMIYVAAEAACGVLFGSLALLADAGHNLGDVLGLVAAWLAFHLSQRAPGGRYTYGLRRSSILAALSNAILLLVITGGIAWEAVRRFYAPVPVEGGIIMAIAAIGILINGATALLFLRGRHHDLNIKGAYLHMMADTIVSAGTVGAGALILWTGAVWFDPLVSLVISAVIVMGTWSLLRDALNLSLDAIPAHIDREAVETYLRGLPDVAELHDLHIWGLSTTDTALTAHLVLRDGARSDIARQVANDLKARFHIGHVTVQIETTAMAENCDLRPDHVV